LEYQFEDEPDLTFSIPPWIFIYCDIISPTIMGNLYVPILKIVPLQKSDLLQKQGSFHEFTNLEYFEIEKKYIQTLKMELRSYDKEFLYFDHGVVQLTLSFKRSD